MIRLLQFSLFYIYISLLSPSSYAVLCHEEKRKVVELSINHEVLFEFLEGWKPTLERVTKKLLLQKMNTYFTNLSIFHSHNNEFLTLNTKVKNLKILDHFSLSNFEFEEFRSSDSKTIKNFKLCLKDISIEGDLKISSQELNLIYVDDSFKASVESADSFCLEAYDLHFNYSQNLDVFFKTPPELKLTVPSQGYLHVEFTPPSLLSPNLLSYEKISNFQLNKLSISLEAPLWKQSFEKLTKSLETSLVNLSKKVRNRLVIDYVQKINFEKVKLFRINNQSPVKEGTLRSLSLSLDKTLSNETVILNVDVCDDLYPVNIEESREKPIEESRK